MASKNKSPDLGLGEFIVPIIDLLSIVIMKGSEFLGMGISWVLNKYLFYFYQVANWNVSDGGVIKRLYNDNIKKTLIPIPSLKEQEKIVAVLDQFDALTNSLQEGLPREIQLRQKQYEYYRDLLLTFPKPNA